MNFQTYTRTVILSIIISTLLFSCRQLDVFEKNVSIPNYEWKYDLKPGFDFEISDTTAQYTIWAVLRHTDAYKYNNIWLDVTATTGKADTLFRMPHAELQLGNDEKGWEGTGMNDIWEVRKPLSNGPVQFRKKGAYHFSVAQVMRENPLINIMSIGIRVEKVRN